MDTQKEYIKRIDKALRFIDTHLEEDLSLNRVAAEACYSPYHFHRLFKAITGESLNAYIVRRRIEKTAGILMRKKEVNLTDLALRFGFSGSSAFSRAFKQFYGISPSGFRQSNPGINSKIGEADSLFERYICTINHLLNWIKMNAKVETKMKAETQVLVLTQIGTEGLEKAFETVIGEAHQNGLTASAKLVRVFHDSFKVTEASKVRMDIGLMTTGQLPEQTILRKEVLPSGRYFTGHFNIAPAEFEQAWSALFVQMSEAGYEKGEGNPFEVYQDDLTLPPQETLQVDFYIPLA